MNRHFIHLGIIRRQLKNLRSKTFKSLRVDGGVSSAFEQMLIFLGETMNMVYGKLL